MSQETRKPHRIPSRPEVHVQSHGRGLALLGGKITAEAISQLPSSLGGRVMADRPEHTMAKRIGPRTARYRLFLCVLLAVGMVLLAMRILSQRTAPVHKDDTRVLAAPSSARRTVIDNERGAIYAYPYDGNYAGLGAEVTDP